MKNKFKKYSIVALALIGLGVGLLGLGSVCGGEMGGLVFSESGRFVATDTVVEGEIIPEDFARLEVDCSSVRFELVSGNELKFEYRVYEGFEPKVNNEGRTLKIEQPDMKISFNFKSGDNQTYYRLTVPEDTETQVNIKSSSGGVKIASCNISGSVESTSGGIAISAADGSNLKVKSTSGGIAVAGVTCDSLEIIATSGGCAIADCKASSEFSCTTTSGGIGIDTVEAKNVVIEATSGDIEAKNISAEKSETKTSSGDIGLQFTKIASVNAKATSGGVTLTLPGSAEDYSYDCECTSGTIEVDNSRYGNEYASNRGDKTVKINTTSGDIAIAF